MYRMCVVVGKQYLQRNYVGLIHSVLGVAPWGRAKSAMESKVDCVMVRLVLKKST